MIFLGQRCIQNRIDILERMMLIKKNATMIGEFTDRGPKIIYRKSCGECVRLYWLYKIKNMKLNVPNTLLKKDIRDVTAQPTYKVSVNTKHYTDDKYFKFEKIDKSLDLKEWSYVKI